MSVDFEYAIKKDIRNNPIVREVDAARQRAAVALDRASAGCSWSWCCSRPGSTSSWCSTATRWSGCSAERAAEEEINRQLRLELETLRAPQRIEDAGDTKLHLVRRRPTRPSSSSG